MATYRPGPDQDLAVSEEVLKAWLALCAACDAGLPAMCTCPTGDPRAVISALVIERDALLARLVGTTTMEPRHLAVFLHEYFHYGQDCPRDDPADCPLMVGVVPNLVDALLARFATRG